MAATKASGPVPDVPEPKQQKNLVRRQSDYAWILMFFCVLWFLGDRFFPARTQPADLAEMRQTFNSMGFESVWMAYASFFLTTGLALTGLTLALWNVMIWLKPETPRIHVAEQLKTIAVNLMVVLPTYQTGWEFLVNQGYTKVTMDRLEPTTVLLDITLWMLVFELAWYVQHRAMHDNKTLWKYGHEYHHQWKRPEHMIGITNFAFDAVVEGWVTMSSSMAPVLLFPINWYVRAVIGLLYMLFAVLVHWDFFPIRYHINHHYHVVKNYGSHWPIFDMIFGTYQGDYWVGDAWAGRGNVKKVA